MTKIKILDCTLRDGGYYNDWDFHPELVKDYLQTMKDLHVDVIEFGFRSYYKKNIFGAHAYTTDEYINLFGNFDGIKVAVMIDAKDFVRKENSVKNLFSEKNKSQVSIVRVAVDVVNVGGSKKIINELKELGYEVHLNLMQLHKLSHNEIKELVQSMADHNYDVLYIADSFGSMMPTELIKIIDIMKNEVDTPLGFHAHENRGFSLINALTAITHGVVYIEATVLGMGRGAGNLKLESLLIEMENQLGRKIDYMKITGLIDKYFVALKEKYNWGENFLYRFSGINKVHPLYAQHLMDDLKYTSCEKLSSLISISSSGSYKFTQGLISKQDIYFCNEERGNDSMTEVVKLQNARKILILANGPLLGRYKFLIQDFIKKNNPYVISINNSVFLENSLVDAVTCGNFSRILNDWSELKNVSKIIIPYSNLSDNIKKSIIVDHNVVDYGIVVSQGSFAWYNNYCIVPNELSISYALASVSTSKSAEVIYFAGLDGTCSLDFKETEETLDLYSSMTNSIKLLSLTPTNYNVDVVPEIFGVLCE